MDNNPWELLNNDDSDLSSFVCPTNHSSSNSTRLFPGSIGVVQVAIMNRQSRESLSTQDFIMRTHQVVQHEFNINPWLYALDFVRSQGQLRLNIYCIWSTWTFNWLLNSYNCRIGKCWWHTSWDNVRVRWLYFWLCPFNDHHCQELYLWWFWWYENYTQGS